MATTGWLRSAIAKKGNADNAGEFRQQRKAPEGQAETDEEPRGVIVLFKDPQAKINRGAEKRCGQAFVGDEMRHGNARGNERGEEQAEPLESEAAGKDEPQTKEHTITRLRHASAKPEETQHCLRLRDRKFRERRAGAEPRKQDSKKEADTSANRPWPMAISTQSRCSGCNRGGWWRHSRRAKRQKAVVIEKKARPKARRARRRQWR